MPRITRIVLAGLLTCALVASSAAQNASQEEMRSLDDEVQEIKSDVLSIAAELNGLEERLLYPSNTQLAVFVELAAGEDFRLDAVQILIDDQLATHYIYSYKELEALQDGGVQRVFTGNVTTGNHVLGVTVNGKAQSGREFSQTQTFSFNKGIEPKLLGLTLAGPGSGSAAITLGDW